MRVGAWSRVVAPLISHGGPTLAIIPTTPWSIRENVMMIMTAHFKALLALSRVRSVGV